MSSEFSANGYFDDSLTDGHVWALGGYMANPHGWEDFNRVWPQVLADHGVPYLHMREFADSSTHSVYSKWYPAKDHANELTAFSKDLTKVISQTGLRPYCSLIRIKDLDRFNAETGLKLEPYPLVAYGCMILIGRDYAGHPVELVFDHVEKVKSKLVVAEEYARSDKYYGPDGIFDKLVTTGLPESLTSKEILPLQAADFWVWEFRKNHLLMDEWWSREDRPQARDDEQWEHMKTSFEEKYKSFEKGTRKSAQALIQQSDPTCLIWDYALLCDAHKHRDGVWT